MRQAAFLEGHVASASTAGQTQALKSIERGDQEVGGWRLRTESSQYPRAGREGLKGARVFLVGD